jgi:hypothetical protein
LVKQCIKQPSQAEEAEAIWCSDKKDDGKVVDAEFEDLSKKE